MAFRTFLDAQNSIYALMRAEGAMFMERGIRPEKNLFAKRGGFSIALKHSAATAEALSALSREIAGIVPSVAYRAPEIHTTLGSCGMKTAFVYEASDCSQHTTLETLCHIVRCVCRGKHPEVSVDFDGYILTPEVVIATGTPSQSLVDLIGRIGEEARRREVSLQSAWGAHATIARFKSERSGKAVLRLIELIERSPPLGRSIARSIAVGYSLWGLSPEVPRMAPGEIQGQFATYREYGLERAIA